MIHVVDASVAVKWFVDEAGHEKSTLLLRDDIVCCAPDILLVEVANTFRKKVASGEMSREQASYAIEDLFDYLPKIIPSTFLIRDAFSLGIELSHPVADCLYLACARHVGGYLVSADEKFLTKCRPKFAQLVISLDSFQFTRRLDDDTFTVIEKSIVDALVHVSAIYQQTKINIGRNWFEPDVVVLARERLFKMIESWDQNQLVYLQAVCWFGESSIVDPNSHDLLGLWLDRLEHAKETVSSNSREDVAYLVPRLQSLDAGLRILATLNPPSDKLAP